MEEGKSMLIVGGTSGIGSVTACLAAERGYQVTIAGRDPQKAENVLEEIRSRGFAATFIQTDIADARQVEHLVSEVVRRHKRLDCVCNSAAVDVGVGIPLVEVEEEDFDYQMGINLKGIWLCMKYQLGQMLRQGGGSMVNVSSINGLGGARGASIYAAAKSGMLGLTKSAAQEYATAGIRINALCAGAFKTPMLEKVFRKANAENPAAVEAAYNAMIPMQRIGEPTEAAEAILWLLSNKASYVTGHSMIADGGLSASFR